MTLIEKITESKKTGVQYRKSIEIGTRIAELNAFKPNLSDSEEALENSLKIQETLSNVTVRPAVEVETILQSLSGIKRDLSEEKFNVQLSKILLNQSISIRNKMIEAWEKYFAERTASAKEIIQTIKPLIADDILYAKMRSVDASYNRLPPGDPLGIDLINEYLALYHQLMDSLDLDDRILKTLKQLSERGSVSLNDLTASDLEVLRNLGFTKKMKVILDTK